MKKSEHIPVEELSAFLDGECGPARGAAVEAHLQDCAACRTAADELGVMTSGLKMLGDAEPQRDLWRGIERARASGISWWRRFWMVPVSAVAGAAAAVLIVVLLGRAGVEAPGEPAGAVEALQAVADAEIKYRSAIEALEKAAIESSGDWSPETKEIVDAGLAEIDKTIERCRAALKNNPSDREAQDTMLAAYQHKVDFLQDVVVETLDD